MPRREFGHLKNVSKRNKYIAMTRWQKICYVTFRHPLIIFTGGGFYYLLFNPRFTWLIGSIQMIFYIIKIKRLSPRKAFSKIVKSHKSRYWKTLKEYRNMSYNNIAFVISFIVMSKLIGLWPFVILYTLSLSIAGGFGLLIFTIQHNFEGSYASDTKDWDYCRAALEGTSFLILPKFLNWFTADIAYHHLHHLSSAIPNYRLAACHYKLEHLFKKVKRIRVNEFLSSFRCIIWDSDNKDIRPIPTKL